MSSSTMLVMPQPRAAHKLRDRGSEKEYAAPEHARHRRNPSNSHYQESPYPSPPEQYNHLYTESPPHQHHRKHSSDHRRQRSLASPANMPSGIERLPEDVQGMVYSRMDYQSLIHLSTMNRHFHGTIDPQRMADAADKAQFVMRAAKDFPQHRPSEKGHDYKPGNFECYICFKVRSADHFDMLQPQHAWIDAYGHVVSERDPIPGVDSKISLRRFCIECGVKEGLHAPFDCLTTRTGRDLWVCRCRRIWSKPGCLRCPDCRGDCPLRPKKKFGM
ncbi:hypothetical protein VHEMI04789 [[Torrubiella] hemipterigena]|uniref:F-box domain-containing protein n=1 Tax=[Torrubiella] hemipterigena TaxID=1531966 RepID=A0A0A1TFB5_9HYPO|nr:hypothetical protein VHEMI04789 [[Torrubiella] hemipterigena]